MTSKSLFFKLIKADFKNRLWAFALISLGCFFLFPVSAAFMAGEMKEYADAAVALKNYTANMKTLVGFSNALTAFGICVAALVCGMSSFSYLNSRKKVDFYHSIPVRRETLYLANYLDGILLLALPYGLALALAVAIGAANGVDFGVLCARAAAGYALSLIYFVLLYTMTVIAGMLTGHIVVEFLGVLALAGYVPLAAMVTEAYFQSFFDTYYSLEGNLLHKLLLHGSPFMEYIGRISDYLDGVNVWPSAGCAALISVLLAALGCFLYRKRPSEAAGKAMAFAITKPVIRCLISVLSGLSLGLMFWSMRSSLGWALFGIVCGTLIAHCVIEIIYSFDFKKLFSHKLQLAGCVAAAAFVLCVFRFDLAGYDTWLPDADQVKSTSVRVGLLEGWVSQGSIRRTPEGYYTLENPTDTELLLERMECTDTATVREIAADAIRQVQERKARRYRGENEYAYTVSAQAAGAYMNLSSSSSTVSVIGGADGPTAVFLAAKTGTDETEQNAEELWGGWTRLSVCYTMNSGKKICRTYDILLNTMIPQLDRLWANPEFLEACFPLMARSSDWAAAVRYRELEEETVLDELSAKERSELLAVYQKEFAGLTMETMRTEFPVGLIQFASQDLEKALSWWDTCPEGQTDGIYVESYGYISRYTLEDLDYYPVYPSFTQTIALLKQYGVEPGTAIKRLDIRSLDISHYDESYPDGERTVTVSDPAEVQELLQVLKDGNRRYYNELYRTEESMTATVTYRVQGRGSNNTRSMFFPQGGVPESVLTKLAEADPETDG